MSAPDYMNRVLRHRDTGAVAIVVGQAGGMLWPPCLRLKFGDGTRSERLPLAEVEAEWDWVDGVVGLPTAPAVMALPDNVVPLFSRGAGRNVPIQTGPAGGGAA